MICTSIWNIPYYTSTIKRTCIFLTSLQFVFYLWSLQMLFFAVIWQTIVKHSIMDVIVWVWWLCLLVCGTEFFQCNNFNKHLYITTIVFIFNLVSNTGYYTLCIIWTAQDILVSCTTLACLSACVDTVMSPNNVYVLQV